MLKRVKAVFVIIFLNWIVLIFLFYIVSNIIVPFEIHNGLLSVFLTGLLKVIITGFFFVSWLYTWSFSVKMYFTRKMLKERQ